MEPADASAAEADFIAKARKLPVAISEESGRLFRSATPDDFEGWC